MSLPLLTAAALSIASASGRIEPAVHHHAPREDSAAVVHDARRAQTEFERLRMSLLPIESPEDGVCTERIGEFCHYDDDRDSTLPREPDRIRQARDELIAQLDRAAEIAGGDEWVAGQRVRYLVEAGRAAEALTAARGCRAVVWWCEALTAFALHSSGDFPAADTVFAGALRDMPADERCRWTDLSILLDDRARRNYRRLRCEQREEVNARFWWLTDPLLSTPGNERRTEHFSRLTMVRLLEDAPSPYGPAWRAGLPELIVRYGWPRGWARESMIGALPTFDVPVLGYDPAPSWEFAPASHALADPTHAEARDWSLERKRGGSRYAPPYAASFVSLAPLTTVLRRADSVLVIAAAELATGAGSDPARADAVLVLARDPSAPPIVTRATPESSGRVVLVARAPRVPLLASVEVQAKETRSVARARFAPRVPESPVGSPSMSDVLLFSPSDTLPSDADGAIARALGAPRVPAGRSVGLYWELYGLRAADSVAVAIGVRPVRGGWFRQLRESLHLGSRRTPVALGWRETPSSAGPILSRALSIDLSGLAPGRYRVDVVITPSAGAAMTASREIEIVPAGGR